MNYILHLTDTCNLNCKYCYQNKKEKELSFENIKSIIDYETKQNNKKCGIIFYGGEPLLKKYMIYDTIDYIKKQKTKTKFMYGMTTNGTLLDEKFIKYAKKNNFISIAYSIDGKKETQDLNRKMKNGESSFGLVEENAKKLLKKYKDATAMVVVTKNNVKKLVENVEYLFELGFKKINLQINYRDDWNEVDLEVLKFQYNKVGEIYFYKILNEEDVSILALDEKIKNYINEKNCNEECQLGIKSVNIGTDGKIYPCMQFVGEKEYVIGDCKNGIDIEKRNKLILLSHKENEICSKCSIRSRCKHMCCCKNFEIEGDINKVSKIVCEVEKIMIEIADNVANRLYNQGSKLFIQKYYNPKYKLFESIINKNNSYKK